MRSLIQIGFAQNLRQKKTMKFKIGYLMLTLLQYLIISGNDRRS